MRGGDISTAAMLAAFPTTSMILGGLLFQCLKNEPGPRITSSVQHFAAGIVLAAIAGEMVPILEKDMSINGTIAMVIGFVGGVAIMLFVGRYICETLEGDEEDNEEEEHVAGGNTAEEGRRQSIAVQELPDGRLSVIVPRASLYPPQRPRESTAFRYRRSVRHYHHYQRRTMARRSTVLGPNMDGLMFIYSNKEASGAPTYYEEAAMKYQSNNYVLQGQQSYNSQEKQYNSHTSHYPSSLVSPQLYPETHTPAPHPPVASPYYEPYPSYRTPRTNLPGFNDFYQRPHKPYHAELASLTNQKQVDGYFHKLNTPTGIKVTAETKAAAIAKVQAQDEVAEPKAQSKLKGMPWGLIAAAGVDSMVDGLLLGISSVAEPKLGLILAIASTLEMSFLGMSVSATMRERGVPRSTAIVTSVGLPFTILIGGLLGGTLLAGASGLLFIGFIAFGIAALLYLVADELLVEAHAEEDADRWYVTLQFYTGFLLVLLLDRLV